MNGRKQYAVRDMECVKDAFARGILGLCSPYRGGKFYKMKFSQHLQGRINSSTPLMNRNCVL